VSVAFDRRMMARALELAARARGRTSPNPLVGAVITRGTRVLAEGYHKRAGSDHGEAAALRKLGWRAPGATLYVNLEPHDHHGRTPPCTDRVIAAGITRVVVAMRDPNDMVDGRGLRKLRGAGIRVELGLMKDEAVTLNRAWITFITQRRPWVILKGALTLDGWLAAGSGDSRWVTGEAARADVHALRNRVDAILVGAATVRADNPALTTRGIKGGRDAVRIILDGHLTTSPRAKVFREGDSPVLVLTSEGAPVIRRAALEQAGAHIEVVGQNPRIDIHAALKRLHTRGIVTLLVEGGGAVNQSFLEAHAIDELRLYHAPKLLGGEGVPLFRGPGPRRMGAALELRVEQRTLLGGDMMTIAIPEWS